MIRVLYHHRKYIWENAWGDLRHRYAGSVMGIIWNIVIPLSQILIFSLIFTKIMVIRLPNLPSPFAFPIYLCSGFIPWIAFSECIMRGANAFLENAHFLRKMPIPEQVFVAQSAMSATMGLFISFGLLLIIAWVMGISPSFFWFFLPLIIILVQGFGFGIGLLFSILNVFFRDIGLVLGLLIQIWMWITPIVYPETILPDIYLTYLRFNPAYPFIHAIRDVFLFARVPQLWMWWAMIGWALGIPAIGYLILRKLRPEIRDVL